MIWSVYDPTTGLFTGQVLSGPREVLALNVPEHLAAMPGHHDHTACAVEDGKVVPRASEPSTAVLAQQARARRSAMLAASDWVLLRAMETGTEIPQAWSAYRQALRDLPRQATFPTNIDWPVMP